MLSDKTTYRVFTQRQTCGKTKDCLKQLKQDLHAQVKILTARHKNELGLIDSAVPKFLEQFITEKTAKVPIIYLLIKVHKPSGLCGRPIVPSHSWLTTAMSKVVDHLLQQIIKEANITHLVKDTKSFEFCELESIHVTAKEGVFLTADIGSLFTNIDTELGLRLMEEFLTEQQVSSSLRHCIIDLLTFVMKNSYLQLTITFGIKSMELPWVPPVHQSMPISVSICWNEKS